MMFVSMFYIIQGIIGKSYDEKNEFEIINRSSGEKFFVNNLKIENFKFEQYTP